MASKKNPALRVDNLPDLLGQLSALTSKEVLVGFPEENADRAKEEGEKGEITNAALAYIHDSGMPEQNIPARPFMIPSIEEAAPRLAASLFRGAQRVLSGKETSAESELNRAGLIAQASMRRKLNSGIPPPLSDRTLQERARRGTKGRSGAQWELAWRAAGAPPSTQLAKPLIDTGQMRNAINYVIRKVRNGS